MKLTGETELGEAQGDDADEPTAGVPPLRANLESQATQWARADRNEGKRRSRSSASWRTMGSAPRRPRCGCSGTGPTSSSGTPRGQSGSSCSSSSRTSSSASCYRRPSSRSCSRSTTTPRSARSGSGSAVFYRNCLFPPDCIRQFRGRVSHVHPMKSNWMLNINPHQSHKKSINPQLQFSLLMFASEIIWFKAS